MGNKSPSENATSWVESRSISSHLEFISPSNSFRRPSKPAIPGKEIQICIKVCNGRTFALNVQQNSTIEEVKTKINQQEEIPLYDQRLIFCNVELVDDRALADYNIQHESQLYLVLRLKGGGIKIPFNKLNAQIILKFGKGGPEYRTVKPGLSFRTKCKTEGCVANGDVIYVNREFGDFTINREAMTLTCPMCKKLTEPATNCGFYRAQWKFTGYLPSGEKKEIKGEATTEDYYTWKEDDITDWAHLEAQVDPLSN